MFPVQNNMGKSKKLRYKGISPDGNFIIYQKIKEETYFDLNKRTKLWLSSEFLFNESLKKDPEKTKKILNDLIKWNTFRENYEECTKLSFLLGKCETSKSDSDI